MSGPGVPAWLQRVADEARDLDPQRLSRLVPPPGRTSRAASVLVLVASWAGADSVLLLQRSSTLRSHAGQVAFPGGSAEPGDAGPVATALREADEEAGVGADHVDVLATWPQLWIPVTDFAVTPVLAWWRAPREVRPDGTEMLTGALVPLADLADPANRFSVVAPSGWRGPGFETHGLWIWGFTAGLLDRLLAFGGLERPWDPERRIESVPARTAVAAAGDDEELVNG
ncbi:NUDIX hydrolase [Jatrophihabitans sp. YIM 134969]